MTALETCGRYVLALGGVGSTGGSMVAKLKLSESDVTKQVIGFLEAHGFLAIRMNSGLFQRPGSAARIRIGVRGQSDWVVLKAPSVSCKLSPWAFCFFLEIKARGKKLRPEQIEWHGKMIQYGFTVVTADDIDEFIAWVRGTGYI